MTPSRGSVFPSVLVHKSPGFVHWDTRVPRLTARLGKEQRRKGAGVALSQMLSHCTRFLQMGLTHSLWGMCLFRVSLEREEAPKGGAAAEGGGKGEQKQREYIHRRP